MRRSGFGAALAFTLLAAPACYSYTPVDTGTVPPGENVRAYVSRAVMLELEEAIPMEEPIVRGRVARRDAEQLFLRIPVGARQVGFHSEALDQEVPIPIREISLLERREFNRVGTGALVAGSVGAAAVVIFLIMDAYGEQENPEQCPECVDMRLPIFSLPVR